jgi:cellulose synthase/poly-beta-1,6-N-acetylglucosamine synthase-like glycosyltransferase
LKAIEKAKGDLIFTTDADCELPPFILQKYCEAFQNSELQFASGPVTFFETETSFFNRLWEKVQVVEFSSLVGTAAGSIALGSPNMCSGANLCFRKTAFFEVNGYEGNLHLASGDDEFLMHKIAKAFPNGLAYLKDKDAIVLTKASKNLKDFYLQRKRWSSKWKHYSGFIPTILAIFIFLTQMAVLVCVYNRLWPILLLKVILEFVFLGQVLKFLNNGNLVLYVFLVQLIYPFYVIFFGFSGIFGSKTYLWKGRNLQ